MRGIALGTLKGWRGSGTVLLLTALALLMILAATSAGAQEVCIPEYPYCGEEPPAHAPPYLNIRSGSVTVNEGEVAYNTGTYDDTFDEDQGESVTFSASSGTVSTTGTDKGRWSWEMPTDRYGQFHPAGDREHTITITATDSTGRSSNVTFTLTVKPVPPTVEVTSPSDGGAVRGTTTLSATAEDNVEVDRVYFFANGKYVGWDSEAPYEYSWDSTTIADGPVTIMARAYDLSNNTAESARSTTVDNTRPTITGVTPYDRTKKVAATANLTVAFSEAMEAGAINGTTLTLTRKGSTAPIKAREFYDAARKRAVLNPDRRLADGTTYVATVAGGTGGVEDLAGNALDRSKVWSFRTR